MGSNKEDEGVVMSDTRPTIDEILDKLSIGQRDASHIGYAVTTIFVHRKDEAKLALTAYIDDIVESVVGEAPKPYINGKYPKRGESVTIDFENNYRESLVFIQENGRYMLWADQRTRYQTIKQERGL